jgi:hypothetical protein
MLYNFVFYAVLLYLLFRRRGYSNEQLNFRSSNRANDALLILMILLLESTIELSLVSDAIFRLDANQLLVGIPLAFLLNLFGTALPIMVYIYSPSTSISSIPRSIRDITMPTLMADCARADCQVWTASIRRLSGTGCLLTSFLR